VKSINVVNSNDSFELFSKLTLPDGTQYTSQIRNNDDLTSDIILNRDSDKNSYIFNTNDVIKVRITLLDDNLVEKVFNETCYRVLGISKEMGC